MISRRPTDSVQAIERAERDQNRAAVLQKRLSRLRRRVRSSAASGAALPGASDRFGPHWNQLDICLISLPGLVQPADRSRLAASGAEARCRFRWQAESAKPTLVERGAVPP